jgi:hypothetical protein
MKNESEERSINGRTRLFESWSKEFQSKVDRVYDLIGGVHHGELGTNRETLFRNFLRSYLPDAWSVSKNGRGQVLQSYIQDSPQACT